MWYTKYQKSKTERHDPSYGGARLWDYSGDFSAETLQAKREKNDILKILKENANQTHDTWQNYHSKNKVEINIFPD